MDAFPAFFPLRGRRVVIAGDGAPAEARARLLAGSPAEIVRLDRSAASDPPSYAGAALAFVASHDHLFSAAAAAAARDAGVPVNVLDHPMLSDFYTPAIIDRGAVVAAVGTTGAAPVLAQLLRAEIEARIPETIGGIAVLLGERREAIKAAFPELEARRAFMRRALSGPAAHAARDGNLTLAGRALDEAIATGGSPPPGAVVIIIRPPADDLISLRAMRALAMADVVAAPADASALIADHARRDARRLNPGAADAGYLAGLARSGKIVAVVTDEPALAAALEAAGAAVEALSSAPEEP